MLAVTSVRVFPIPASPVARGFFPLAHHDSLQLTHQWAA